MHSYVNIEHALLSLTAHAAVVKRIGEVHELGVSAVVEHGGRHIGKPIDVDGTAVRGKRNSKSTGTKASRNYAE